MRIVRISDVLAAAAEYDLDQADIDDTQAELDRLADCLTE